jgi:hypothetical protein
MELYTKVGEFAMLDFRNQEIIIVEALQKHLGCPVVRANQTAPIPPYPYVSYTLMAPITENKGTWGKYDDGKDRKPITQTWSITVQSDDSTESQMLSLKAHDWFDYVGTLLLTDNNIIVQSVTDINNRDNLLTIAYEYRNGFDVVFWFLNEVPAVTEATGYIEEAVINDVLYSRENENKEE